METNRRSFLSATATAAAATLGAASPVLAQSESTSQTAQATFNAAPSAVAYAAPTEIKKVTIINLRELEPAAQKIIPPGGFGYIASAAGDEWTKHENEAAYKRITILPHYLSGVDAIDMSTSLLGAQVSMPIITTVMGGHGLAHVTAEGGTAKGAAAVGALFTEGSQSTLALEDVMAASSGPKWFQIYLQKDPGVNRELLTRAKNAGYRAVVVTLDAQVNSNRETDVRNNFHSPLPSGNFPGKKNGGYGTSPFKINIGWDDIKFVQDVTGLPVIIKGVLHPDLAREAVKRGVAGIQVSNHGGRQLDDVPASITMLPHIAEAVGGRILIVIDGGIRRGQDVFKALALGANAVAIGRPVLFGLALGGWMGVQGVLEHLQGELAMTMRLAGTRTLADISKRYLNNYT
jgi:isopentenyl diphosphate isomerase/L-lactate dehydrogenase-like FMN-dependent dehydrogenase